MNANIKQKVVELVEPNSLTNMLEQLIDDCAYLEIENHDLNCEGKTVVSGTGSYRTVQSREPPMYSHRSYFDFEVNIGTSIEECINFKQLEVCITFKEQ